MSTSRTIVSATFTKGEAVMVYRQQDGLYMARFSKRATKAMESALAAAAAPFIDQAQKYGAPAVLQGDRK